MQYLHNEDYHGQREGLFIMYPETLLDVYRVWITKLQSRSWKYTWSHSYWQKAQKYHLWCIETKTEKTDYPNTCSGG